MFGLSDLSLQQVQKLELALRSKGEVGLAQPAVLLVMPQQVGPDDSDNCSAVYVGSSCPQRFQKMDSKETLDSAWKRLSRENGALRAILWSVTGCLTACAIKVVFNRCLRV